MTMTKLTPKMADTLNAIEEKHNVAEMEFEVKKGKVQREYDKLQTSKEAYADIKSFSPAFFDSAGSAESAKQIYTSISEDRRVIKEGITFINKGLTDVIPFARGSLYLIGAISGHGKSTTAANVSFPLYQQNKKVLVIANEEVKHHVLGRIACLELGLDFNMWRNAKMDRDTRRRVDLLLPKVEKYVHVLGTDQQKRVSTMEGLQTVLEAVKDTDYSCILIDYFQNISSSVEVPSLERQQVLYHMRDYLNSYVTRAKMPVVLFVQLMPLPPNSQSRQFEARIKWCRGIYEAATTAIEIVRIKSENKSMFVIDKDRFGMADVSIECKFDSGRYVFIDPMTLADEITSKDDTKI